MSAIRKPTRFDVVWNVAALVAFAGGALVANVLIARHYGPFVTGILNQTLALYIVASQFAVLGIHLAALREASLAEPDRAPTLTLEMLLALVKPITLTTLAGLAFSFVVPLIFQAESLDASWRLALIGLPCFAINKVLINLASGFGYFRFYGAAQAARSLLFLLISLLWIGLDLDGRSIALAIACSEVIVCLFLLLFFRRKIGLHLALLPKKRLLDIRRFGLGVMPSVAIADINTRIDILVLGTLASAEQVGIYSIAAWIVEGALQLPVAIRPMINAPMARMLRARDFPALRNLVHRVGGSVMAVMALSLTLTCLLFPWACVTILQDQRYVAALTPLIILSLGAVGNSWASPFDMMLVQAARLKSQFMLKAGAIAINLALAPPLIMIFGTAGAAGAYAASLIGYGLLLRALVRRSIGPVI